MPHSVCDSLAGRGKGRQDNPSPFTIVRQTHTPLPKHKHIYKIEQKDHCLINVEFCLNVFATRVQYTGQSFINFSATNVMWVVVFFFMIFKLHLQTRIKKPKTVVVGLGFAYLTRDYFSQTLKNYVHNVMAIK